jgi:nitrite reductase (NO-forming)
MEIEEKLIEIDAEGTKIWALTFNGSVPGPIIVVHQDDYVELTLVNPATNSLPHNIDLHAATGALGGGELTNVAPGQEVVLRFKAVKPGVFRLPLCARRDNDTPARGLRHERGHHGPA